MGAFAQLMEANLNKLVKCPFREQDITETPSVIRDMALVKVETGAEKAGRTSATRGGFSRWRRSSYICPGATIAEITGSPDKIDAFVEVLKPFGITEMVQTGRIAMTRGVEGDASRISARTE